MHTQCTHALVHAYTWELVRVGDGGTRSHAHTDNIIIIYARRGGTDADLKLDAQLGVLRIIVRGPGE